jgi:hypothetical protein
LWLIRQMVDEAYFVEDDKTGGSQFRMVIYRMTGEGPSDLDNVSLPSDDK